MTTGDRTTSATNTTRVWIFVLGVLALYPMFSIAQCAIRYSVNMPFWDHWEYVKFFQATDDGTFGIKDLWAQHSESRPAFYRLYVIAMAYLTGWNTRVEVILAAAVFSGLIVAGLFMLNRRTLKLPLTLSLLLMAVLNPLLFNKSSQEAWVENLTPSHFVAPMCLIFCLIAASGQGSFAAKTAWNFLLCFLATFTFAAGIVLWPLATAGLIALNYPECRQQKGALAGWFMGMAATCVVYFYDYQPVSVHSSFWDVFMHPIDALMYLLVFLGAPLNNPVFFSPTFLPEILGGILLALFLACLAYLAKYVRDAATWRAAVPWLILACYALLSGMMATAHRLNFGVAQASSSRYLLHSVYLPIAIAHLSLLVTSDWRRRMPHRFHERIWIATASAAATAIVFVRLLDGAWADSSFQNTQARHLMGRTALAFINIMPNNDLLSKTVYPQVEELPARARFLDGRGWIQPPLIKNTRIRGIEDTRSAHVGRINVAQTLQDAIEMQGWALLSDRGRPPDAIIVCADSGNNDPQMLLWAIPQPPSSPLPQPSDTKPSNWSIRVPLKAIPKNTARLLAYGFDVLTSKAYQLNLTVELGK